MNRNTIIFVIVGGVGIYLTYKYLQDHGYLAQWLPDLFGPGGEIVPVGSGAGSGSGAGAGAGSGTGAGSGAGSGSGSGQQTGGGTPVNTQPVPCAQDALLCWDGSYKYRTGPNCTFPACPPQPTAPPPGSGKTAAQLAAETLAFAKQKLVQDLIAAGVDPNTAQTYVDHCGTNGQCDQAYLDQMYGQAAIGVPNMMKLTDVGGILFNADQWNWFRNHAGAAVDIDPGEVFSDRGAQIHASTFNAAVNRYLSGGGMSGVSDVNATLAWLM